MPYLHQYDYIFAIGTIFALLDAYNIGANDVANSFATSVSSRSLTMPQAVVAATIMEFLGAILAGSRVAGTIKNGIISLGVFQDNPGVELLAFACALVASATWLTIATRNAWPVSTTYSIVSSLAGVGVALGGADAVQWGWNDGKGLGTIFAGFGIAPAIAAGFGAVIFLITKFAILKRSNSVRAALIASPVYFFGVTAILTLTIVYKGAPNLNLDKLSGATQALAIVMTSLVIAVLSILFWLPYVYAKVVKKDYTIRWYHFFFGPLLWKREAPAINEELVGRHVPDYRQYGRDGIDPDPRKTEHQESPKLNDTAISPGSQLRPGTGESDAIAHQPQVALGQLEKSTPQIEGPWIYPRNVWILLRYRIPKALTYGLRVDVASGQAQKGSADEKRMLAVHEASEQYGNETEHLFSFLQVLTACTNSFAHGSNDTANAIGPWAVIYHVWSTGLLTTKNTDTPTWMWAVGGIMIGVGVATYGYNVMRVLGNRLTLMSPSRGFSMELGSSITVLLASQYGIPVSTTMCITGSTAGVGLVSGGPKAINWRAFGWILLGWVITVPAAGIAGGCLMGIILNAPHF